MKFQKKKTFTSEALIKDNNGKVIDKLRLTYGYLGIRAATKLVDEKKEMFEMVGDEISEVRIEGMTIYLNDKLINHLDSWNLTGEGGEKLIIDSETLSDVFDYHELFWAIWEDWNAYLMRLSSGVDAKRMMRELERKNYGK